MAEKTENVQNLRTEYASLRTTWLDLTPKSSRGEFGELVKAQLGDRERTPSNWVYAAQLVVNRRWAEVDRISEAEMESYEGFLGTGMNEADYYRQAGSAE